MKLYQMYNYIFLDAHINAFMALCHKPQVVVGFPSRFPSKWGLPGQPVPSPHLMSYRNS